jgi:structural maintenance of chromosome 2
VTYIPLNVIDSRTIPNDVVQKLKHYTNGKVYLAKELIEYDTEIEPAVNFVFGNIFVAEDEDTAKKVAFYNDFGKFNCVTIKGDKYSPAGTLEGGFKKEGGYLLRVQKYKDLN